MLKTFVTTVQHHFQFLIAEFDFVLSMATDSPRGEPWEGKVQYLTKTTLIDLNCTRGESPDVSIGRRKDDGKYLLPLQVIYEYGNLSHDEKQVVLSSPDGRKATNILYEKQLIHLVPQANDISEKIELQINTYAKVLREYSLPLLRGDFSNWLPMWDYHVHKLIIENIRAGRPQFVPTVVTDSDGKLRVVDRQPVFKKGLDYIDQLKNEQNI